MEPYATRVAKSMRFLLNLRMDMYGPSRARGGKTILTRLPSFSLASTIGLLSSTRRPTSAAIRWQILDRCATSRKWTVESETRPLRSTNTRLGPLTIMSATLASSSRGSRGPRPNMSWTSSPARCFCSRPFNCIRRSVAISDNSRSTSEASLSAGIPAIETGSSLLMHICLSSAAKAELPLARTGAIGSTTAGATIVSGLVRRPNALMTASNANVAQALPELPAQR